MALEPGPDRATSPASSGGSSPAIRAPRVTQDEEAVLKKDKSYRRYAAGVERTLALFDTALQGWADYISFLGRLLKALQAHPANTKVVPLKAVVAKRLAQCLKPSLPSGVHQKALELYTYIFELIGKDALSRDLPIYLPGLASTLSFASLTVRPLLLSLLENHLSQVDTEALRPALRAIILAILPGLEEDTSEDFDRTLRVLESFKEALSESSPKDPGRSPTVGQDYFWQCFFLASITSPSRRQGALAYLSRRLPRLVGTSQGKSVEKKDGTNGNITGPLDPVVEAVVSPEPGLFIRCFAAGLADEQMLIQRGFLELLVTHVPLSSPVLQERLASEDLERLVIAAVGVVSRRDMGLNRRLWTWLLGPESPNAADADSAPASPVSGTDDERNSTGDLQSPRTRHFQKFGLPSLLQGLLKMIEGNSLIPAERARPFRICLSLMDRWEIGGLVVPSIFLPALESARQFEAISPSKESFIEVVRSANVFFDGVESGLIWGEILGLVSSAMTAADDLGRSQQSTKIELVKFIITNFNIREEEMLAVHMPTVALVLLIKLSEASHNERKPSSQESQTAAKAINGTAFSILENMIEIMPKRTFLPTASHGSTPLGRQNHQWPLRNEEILTSVHKFYDQDQGNLEISSPPFSSQDIGDLLLVRTAAMLKETLKSQSPSEALLQAWSRVLVLLLHKVSEVEITAVTELMPAFKEYLSSVAASRTAFLSFRTFSSIVSVFVALCASEKHLAMFQSSSLVSLLVHQAWHHLAPNRPKYHVEAVRCLWQIQWMMPEDDHSIEAALCSLLVQDDLHGTYSVRPAEPGRRFAVLWTHSISVQGAQAEAMAFQQSSKRIVISEKRMDGYRNIDIMLTRPLFLLLDALEDEATELFVFVKGWLQGVSSVDKVFHVFINRILALDYFQWSVTTSKYRESQQPTVEGSPIHDIDVCLYYFRTLSNVLKWSTDQMWTALANNALSNTETGNADMLKQGLFEPGTSMQMFLIRACMFLIERSQPSDDAVGRMSRFKLQTVALSVLHLFLTNPFSNSFAELELEHPLLERLLASLEGSNALIQVPLLDVTIAALRLRVMHEHALVALERRRSTSKETIRTTRLSISTERSEKEKPSAHSLPPARLLKCLQGGFSSSSSRPVLEDWTRFLADCLDLYSEAVFQLLLPIAECLCAQIETTFNALKHSFREGPVDDEREPESTLITMLNALEQILAKAHDRLINDEMKRPSSKPQEQPQGFFGNMVSGVWAGEAPQSRSITANHRLTVLLSFKDSVRACFSIWSWDGYVSGGKNQDPSSMASFNHTSLRTRNRARRLLEHLFTAEALECLETIIEIWQQGVDSNDNTSVASVFSLLHVLDGSRPKNTIPAIFNAIYSRTNPGALEPVRKSTLTSDLADVNVVTFLADYTRSLEDDAMDEIWGDCMTFLRDVLANPFPHRQTLPMLLEFIATLGEKVDNTNFGEQRKMRRELSELFVRLLTAIFTTKPFSVNQTVGQADSTEESEKSRPDVAQPAPKERSDDIVGILASIVPHLPQILDADRLLGAATTISSSVIGPTFRAKSFPEVVSQSTLELLYQLSRIPNAQKAWRRDIAEAFNHPRFFVTPLALAEKSWLPLLRQWALGDKDRMPELLSRLSPPTTAGIMFGVGATSARLESDRKAQLNLKRIALLLIAGTDDNFAMNMDLLEEKIVEILTATAASSPSSTGTRAEVYMLLRALVLRTSSIHLTRLWPVIDAELQTAIPSVLATTTPDDNNKPDYTPASVLQACKLLDTLLVIAPDEFQLHEWLFITDTIDAVYRPGPAWRPVALVDVLSEEAGSGTGSVAPPSATTALLPHSALDQSTKPRTPRRRPLLGPDAGRDVPREALLEKVLKPFFHHLSLHVFESTYSMGVPDRGACVEGLLVDLFEDGEK